MYEVFLKFKYGFNNFGRPCVKIHFTDIFNTKFKLHKKIFWQRHPMSTILKSTKGAFFLVFAPTPMEIM